MSDPDERPSVKFLTVVWGKAYIDRLTSISLPSFLAPGNLPALSAITNLEVVIMTANEDIAYFEALPIFQVLIDTCAVRFVLIDDLISNSEYGITLSLAYARPIIQCGAQMTNTHFVFMNADFVLGDGSLRALAAQITKGHSVVLGPSFRAIAEEIEPTLVERVNQDSHILSISPRELTGMSLPQAHVTTLAKVQNDTFIHSTHPNQMFWRVDQNTLLGRYYLIFMLCIKPSQQIHSLTSYCDYALIPQLCPQAREVVMSDSDDFFMLELQARNQERHLVKLGEAPAGLAINKLAQWTTAEHRRASAHDIIFHAQEIPASLPSFQAKAEEHINSINARLPAPVPFDRHPNWVGGVQSWRSSRAELGLSNTCPELNEESELPKKRLPFHTLLNLARVQAGRLSERMASTYFGRKPMVGILHPTWLEFKHLKDTLAAARTRATTDSLIVICRDPAFLKPLLTENEFKRSMTFAQAIEQAASSKYPDGSDIFVYAERGDLRRSTQLLRRWEQEQQQPSSAQFFFHATLADDRTRTEFCGQLQNIAPQLIIQTMRVTHFELGGGRYRHFLQTWGLRVVRRFSNGNLIFSLPSVVALTCAVPLLVLVNFTSRNNYLGSQQTDKMTTMTLLYETKHSARTQPG